MSQCTPAERRFKSSHTSRTILFSADLSGKTQTSSGAMGVSRQILSNMQNHYPVRQGNISSQNDENLTIAGTVGSRMPSQGAVARIALHDSLAAFRGVGHPTVPFDCHRPGVSVADNGAARIRGARSGSIPTSPRSSSPQSSCSRSTAAIWMSVRAGQEALPGPYTSVR